MRHLKAGRKLNRNATHRAALMRNLTRALIEHGKIITTVAKAKEVRPFVEKLITLAKNGSLHARRLAVARLHDKETVKKLFDVLAVDFRDRPGGYTRVVKRPERRLGDAGPTAYIELLKPGESRKPARRTPPPAPAPTIAPEPAAPPPAPAPAATEQPAAPAPAPEGQTQPSAS